MLAEAWDLLARIRIRLHKICSLSRTIVEAFPISEIAKAVQVFDLCVSACQAALGLVWDVGSDALSIRFTGEHRAFTKRGVLTGERGVFCSILLVLLLRWYWPVVFSSECSSPPRTSLHPFTLMDGMTLYPPLNYLHGNAA